MAAPAPAAELPAPPPMTEHIYPGDKGYVKLFVPEGEVPEAPAEPEKPKRQARGPESPPVAALEVAIPADTVQKQMIDELGELDRRRQLHLADDARFETLKKAVKNWCSDLPTDSDVIMQGMHYVLRISGCERERRVRDLREVVERIGIDRLLQIATVPIGELQKLMGTAELEALLVETRSGSRRIRCIPRFPAVPPT